MNSYPTFKQYMFEASPVFRYVYHIAPKAQLANIKSVGLTPSARAQGDGWQHLKYEKPAVFVVTRNTKQVMNDVLTMLSNKNLKPGQTHEDWTDADWAEFNNSYALLTVDVSKCKNVDLEPDPRTGAHVHSKMMYAEIPPEAIVNSQPIALDWS